MISPMATLKSKGTRLKWLSFNLNADYPNKKCC